MGPTIKDMQPKEASNMDTRRPGGQQTRGGLETGCLEASSLEEDWRPGGLEAGVEGDMGGGGKLE